jgi:FliI/YscN family ATPase
MTTPQDPLDVLHVLRKAAGEADGVVRVGRVRAVRGPLISALFPEASIGEMCLIDRAAGMAPLHAEVVGFDGPDVLMLPLGETTAIRSQALVRPVGSRASVPAGAALRGRVLDAMGEPLSGGALGGVERAPLDVPPPNPLTREPVRRVLATGVRAIDTMLTIGRGQRVGIFAGAGVGKSTLLGAIARHVEADLVVLALIGERGREVRGFLDDVLGSEGLARSVVVVSTSDEPALRRLRAAQTATAIAEHARAQGQHVVLMMDSVTRYARALREVGLAAGEPAGRQGYPASVFAALPRLFERAGNDHRGSITGLYTVLVTGDDMQEPVADEAMSLLDGHIVLSRKLASRGHYPAIDMTGSKSRLRDEIIDDAQRQAATRVLSVIGAYEQNYDKISMNLYQHSHAMGTPDPTVWYPRVAEFLKQDLRRAPVSCAEGTAQMHALAHAMASRA